MSKKDELRHLLNGFEHECYMLRVEASETRAKDEAVREAYERIREEAAQAIAATLGGKKAKAHPYGYEPDTGAFDVTRCECGCLNDISATYCNDCGGEIEIDMGAEKEIYHTLRHLVFAEKHDDGSLEFGGKRYVTATLGGGKLTAEQVRETVEKHWHDLPADYDMPEATALPEYSYDWQAIADELNASLGGSECGYEARGFAPFRITAKNADARFGKR